jgi:hypothetical protein
VFAGTSGGGGRRVLTMQLSPSQLRVDDVVLAVFPRLSPGGEISSIGRERHRLSVS